MNTPESTPAKKEISCRVTRTLLMYLKEANNGSLGPLLSELPLAEAYLSDTNNWVSHEFLQVLYHRMIDILKDGNAVYQMTLASERFQSLGLLDRIARLLGNPKLIYSLAPQYNKMLKLNGDIIIHDIGDTWALIEDRYHISAQKTRFDCDCARAALAVIPTWFGLPVADVEEIECQVHSSAYGSRIWPDHPRQDCSGCLYRVNWSKGLLSSFRKQDRQSLHVYDQAILDLQNTNQHIQEKYEEARQLAFSLETADKELIASKQQLEAKQAELIASEKKSAELTTQLHKAQKMESLGNLAASVAHDLNNILSSIVSYPELILWELPQDSPLRNTVTAIRQSGLKAAAIVQDMLTLSRRNVSTRDVVNLNGIIHEYLASPEHDALMKNNLKVRVESRLADDLFNLMGSPVHLLKLIMNLIFNAAEAMPAGGRIAINTQNVYLDKNTNGYEPIPKGEYVRLRFRDEGIGISQENLKRIFEPFFSNKQLRRSGSGLGMTIVWATIKDHNGYVDLASREGEGTQIDVYLPATRELTKIKAHAVLEDYLGT